MELVRKVLAGRVCWGSSYFNKSSQANEKKAGSLKRNNIIPTVKERDVLKDNQ